MENKRAFAKRLKRFAISKEMREKYLKVYDQMAAAHKMSAREVRKRVLATNFAGYITSTGRLLYCKRDIERSKVKFRLISIATDENLLRNMTVKKSQTADNLQLKGKFKVYVRGDIFDPKLYLRDILAQIPAERLKGVTAISLKLDDVFPEHRYNILADAYEYEVELFG